MNIYLAGPMRGYPDSNRAAFADAARFLREMGHKVWSPAEEDQKLGLDADTADIVEVFQRDLQALLTMDAVVLLDDWARSHGACLERHTADVVGIPVFMLRPGADEPLVRLSPHDWRWRAK